MAYIPVGINKDGKRRRRVVYGKTKHEVQEKLRVLQNDLADGMVADPDCLSVEQLLDTWLASVKQRVRPTTYRRYEQHVKLHLKPRLGKIALNKLTAFHVIQLYGGMEKDGASPSERQKTGTALSMALKYGVHPLKLLKHNPASEVPKPKPEEKEMHVLDPDQVPVFLKAAESDRLSALYVLALDSGMRQGELFALQWPDIDFETGSAMVQRSLEELNGRHVLKDTKTKKGRRRIILSAYTLAALNDHRKRMLAEGHVAGPVFCNTEGGWLFKSSVRTWSFLPILGRTNGMLEQAGKPRLPSFRFHDLRHSAATLLLLAGENPKVVSERLGHARIEVTLNIYSHVLPTLQQAAAEKMGRILGQTRPQNKAE
jgi:integrase